MNRRKAILNMALFTGAGAAALGGYGYFRFFSKPALETLGKEEELLSALAETIIPATDTPGARECGVGPFIMLMVKDCTPRTSQNRFLDGLMDVKAYAADKFGKPFTACSVAERGSIIAHFEKRDRPYGSVAGKISKRLIGDSFFVTLKKYTVLGYCSSQPGATKAMAYDYIPGSYQGCMPLQPGQKCWST